MLPLLLCAWVCLSAVVGGMLCKSDKPSIIIIINWQIICIIPEHDSWTRHPRIFKKAVLPPMQTTVHPHNSAILLSPPIQTAVQSSHPNNSAVLPSKQHAVPNQNCQNKYKRFNKPVSKLNVHKYNNNPPMYATGTGRSWRWTGSCGGGLPAGASLSVLLVTSLM